MIEPQKNQMTDSTNKIGILITLIQQINQRKFSWKETGFISKRTCVDAIGENMNINAEAIDAWLANQSSRGAATFDCTHNFVIGLGIIQGNNQPSFELKKSRIILLKDTESESNYLLCTAFPLIEEESRCRKIIKRVFRW